MDSKDREALVQSVLRYEMSKSNIFSAVFLDDRQNLKTVKEVMSKVSDRLKKSRERRV